jgi:2-amino-4-hydroxy-6-hydroxymethyldihydropteridine diphosphokinase
VVASSPVYETEPVGEIRDQRAFLNACLQIRTGLDPEELLDECKAIERELGRDPGGPRHGPRPIDIDVLLIEGVEHRSDRLTLPHRDLLARRFVLVPMLDIDAEIATPAGARLAAALAALDDRAWVREDGPPLV